MGTTDVTVDQGGSGGSDALQTDGYPMRRVAAEARRVLLEMASARLGVPVAQLVVSDGVVSVAADPSKRVTYGELIGGRKFNVTLNGNNINATTGAARAQGRQSVQDRRPVAAALRHSREGGRLAEVGRRRQGARHAPRAQREAAGRRREAREHRRVVREGRARLRQGGEQGQLRRGGLRARGAGDSGGAPDQGELAEAGDGAVPLVRGSLRLHARRDAHVEHAAECRGQSRRGHEGRGQGHRGRLRDPVPGAHRRSVRRTRWPIRRTIS